jgi:hypothetical protein
MVALSSTLAGCFSSNPSESDGKDAVLQVYKKYIDSGDVVVESVNKTDGMAMEQGGVKMYAMNVDITLKFPKGIDCKIDWHKNKDIDNAKCMALGAALSDPIAPGASKMSSHKLTFMKSEKGWQLAPFIGFI